MPLYAERMEGRRRGRRPNYNYNSKVGLVKCKTQKSYNKIWKKGKVSIFLPQNVNFSYLSLFLSKTESKFLCLYFRKEKIRSWWSISVSRESFLSSEIDKRFDKNIFLTATNVTVGRVAKNNNQMNDKMNGFCFQIGHHHTHQGECESHSPWCVL